MKGDGERSPRYKDSTLPYRWLRHRVLQKPLYRETRRSPRVILFP